MRCDRLAQAVILSCQAAHALSSDAGYPQGLQHEDKDGRQRFWVHDNEFDGHKLPFGFAGLNTFAKLPYENCFENDGLNAPKFDIAILGAPHDTVSRAQVLHEDPDIHMTQNSRPSECHFESHICSSANVNSEDRHCTARCKIWAIWNPGRKPAKGLRIQHLYR